MNEIESHKKNHFVPRVYLKSWAQDKSLNLFTLNLKDKLTRKQTTGDIAHKKNLYTLNFESKKDKTLEKIMYPMWEIQWPKIVENLRNDIIDEYTLRIIKQFVIVQSFRTPKFVRENYISVKGTEYEMQEKMMFPLFLIVGLPALLDNCVCKLYKINSVENFITCDNPSTHWYLHNNDRFSYISGIMIRQDLQKDKRYKIICPLTPKYLAMLSPNLGANNITESDKKKFSIKVVNSEEIKHINRMIEHGADKLLMAKYPLDLIY